MRLLLVAGIIYCAFHFEENPDVLGTIALILFVLLVVIGHSQIWVYEDSVVEKSDSIIGMLFKWKHRVILISELNKASIIPEELPGYPRSRNSETQALITDADVFQRIKIVETVNRLIEQCG